MTRITDTLESIWYQDKKPPFLLILLSKLYGFLMNARRTLFDLGLLSSNKPDIPVIIIGNLNIGGTGKTPFTLYSVSYTHLRAHETTEDIVIRLRI